MHSLSNSLRNALLSAALNLGPRRAYRQLIDASFAPGEAQTELLGGILASNAETEFGKNHDFDHVKSLEDYRSAVPIQTYEDLRPHIERQELTGQKILTTEKPVYYHRTSGTVGTPKNIPVTTSGLARIRRHQMMSAYAQFQGSRIFDGKVFGVSGQAIEGRMPGGTPYGSASGLLYENQSKFVRSRYVLPPALSEIDDYDARYFAMAVFGLLESSVTCIATANPSTLVKLLSVINERSEEILDAVSSGSLPDSIFAGSDIDRRLGGDSSRAQYLAGILRARGRLDYADFWPGLGGIVTWTGGSCGVPLGNLATALPTDCRLIELGYLASEIRGTVNVDVKRNVCLPTLLETVFEFAEREAWEAGRTDFSALHELEVGRDYYVFVTTADGLYRYDMNDILRVTGRLNATPTLDFVQKGKGITNITGEKLYEAQILEAVVELLSEYEIRSEFFIMLADQRNASYTLYVEAEVPRPDPAPDLGTALDNRLRTANIEYDAKRGSGRLSPLDIRWLRPGVGNEYRESRVAAGQRDAQFKYLHLQYADECAFDFFAATKGT